jgi:dihydroxy-acid dehydratase
MAAAIEALGMSLPGSASIPAVDARIYDAAYRSGQQLMRLVENGIKPRDIMTYEAFENAVTTVCAMAVQQTRFSTFQPWLTRLV